MLRDKIKESAYLELTFNLFLDYITVWMIDIAARVKFVKKKLTFGTSLKTVLGLTLPYKLRSGNQFKLFL